MNIFALSQDPLDAARWQHDRHVVKMTLETAQLLSTAVWHADWTREIFTLCHPNLIRPDDSAKTGSVTLYKSISNPNHPSAVWVRESSTNLLWTICHMQGLIGEYHRRFQKLHGCLNIANAFLSVGAHITGVDRFWTRDENRQLVIDPAILRHAALHDPFHYAGPSQYLATAYDSVDAYRSYYLMEKLFQDHVKWTRCDSLPRFILDADHRYPSRVLNRITDLVRAHENQTRAPIVERVVAKPHVPVGMEIPAFLRNRIK